MKNTTLNYKCPKCGGKLEFDSKTQMMKCPYCDSLFPVEDFKTQTVSSEVWNNNEGFGLYHCNSCSAEIIADAATASTHCPYCDSPVILTDKLSGTEKPDCLIPFKYDKKAAKEALGEHFKGKKFLPKVFSTENHLDEIKGIYVPFYLFDTTVNVEAAYEMKNTRMWSDTRNQYTETSIFRGDRNCMIDFSKVPIDSMKEMPNEITESLEMYDYSQLTDFDTAYLSGYFANIHDESENDCLNQVSRRIANTAMDRVDSSVNGYASVRRINESVKLQNVTSKYALLPVWILNTTWKDQKYVFAMNGQTGKFVGNLPIDIWTYWKYRLLYALGFGVVLYIILQFLFR